MDMPFNDARDDGASFQVDNTSARRRPFWTAVAEGRLVVNGMRYIDGEWIVDEAKPKVIDAPFEEAYDKYLEWYKRIFARSLISAAQSALFH